MAFACIKNKFKFITFRVALKVPINPSETDKNVHLIGVIAYQS